MFVPSLAGSPDRSQQDSHLGTTASRLRLVGTYSNGILRIVSLSKIRFEDKGIQSDRKPICELLLECT